ncbi:hypothetical protein QYF36_001110 [Acer negundo]|nr:hypothetical protein QYF36_001110 [Acer negundo]
MCLGNPPAEREHIDNNPSLRGFKVLDEAKAQLESICPNTVSCAHILAFATRDSSLQVGGINYAVPAGRCDGRVSLSDEVGQNLQPPFFKAGMSVDEMVTLSGAHSIGVSHCSSFSDRLYSFNATHPQDPSMDPRFASFSKTRCPPTSNGTARDPTVVLELSNPNRLDNKYYSELMNRRGLLTSDQTLNNSPFTSKMVSDNARNGAAWGAKYARDMVHMGSLDVLTGTQGEIRRLCI